MASTKQHRLRLECNISGRSIYGTITAAAQMQHCWPQHPYYDVGRGSNLTTAAATLQNNNSHGIYKTTTATATVQHCWHQHLRNIVGRCSSEKTTVAASTEKYRQWLQYNIVGHGIYLSSNGQQWPWHISYNIIHSTFGHQDLDPVIEYLIH